MKYGSPNLLEPSGPVQACTGIALPFTFTFTYTLPRNFATLRDKTALMIECQYKVKEAKIT